MISAISASVQGYDRAEATVNAAAAQIANYPGVQGGALNRGATPTDSADLSATAVSLLQGKDMAQANLASFHVADQMQKSLLELLG